MLHILLVPALILLMIVLHLFMVVVHKHTQYPGPGRNDGNVVGYPLGPVYAAKAGGFFFIVFGVIALMAAFFTINPIWNYGPYDPSPVSAGTQPDWYIGWVDGALRLMPGVIGDFHFEYVIFGSRLTLNVLLPALVPAGILFTVMFMYPWIESWITKDNREHHVLDRPRNAPTRTAIGVAGFVWYCVMWAAAGSDLIATHFHVSLNDVTYWLRALFFLGPIIAFIVTKRVALALQRKDREIALHGRETGRIVRLPHGEFIEVHAPLDEYKRYKLVGFESPVPAAGGAQRARHRDPQGKAARDSCPGGSSRTGLPLLRLPSWRPPTATTPRQWKRPRKARASATKATSCTKQRKARSIGPGLSVVLVRWPHPLQAVAGTRKRVAARAVHRAAAAEPTACSGQPGSRKPNSPPWPVPRRRAAGSSAAVTPLRRSAAGLWKVTRRWLRSCPRPTPSPGRTVRSGRCTATWGARRPAGQERGGPG